MAETLPHGYATILVLGCVLGCTQTSHRNQSVMPDRGVVNSSPSTPESVVSAAPKPAPSARWPSGPEWFFVNVDINGVRSCVKIHLAPTDERTGLMTVEYGGVRHQGEYSIDSLAIRVGNMAGCGIGTSRTPSGRPLSTTLQACTDRADDDPRKVGSEYCWSVLAQHLIKPDVSGG